MGSGEASPREVAPGAGKGGFQVLPVPHGIEGFVEQTHIQPGGGVVVQLHLVKADSGPFFLGSLAPVHLVKGPGAVQAVEKVVAVDPVAEMGKLLPADELENGLRGPFGVVGPHVLEAEFGQDGLLVLGRQEHPEEAVLAAVQGLEEGGDQAHGLFVIRRHFGVEGEGVAHVVDDHGSLLFTLSVWRRGTPPGAADRPKSAPPETPSGKGTGRRFSRRRSPGPRLFLSERTREPGAGPPP